MDSYILVSTHETVQKIIEMIQKKQGGIYLRYGDGDFNILLGQYDMLANPTPEFQHWMRESMKISDDSVLTSIPHHCKEINTLEEGMCGGNHECPLHMFQGFIKNISTFHVPTRLYSSVALCYCASHFPDTVIELHREIKMNNVLYIGNTMYSNEFLSTLFGISLDQIHVPQRDSFLEHDRVFLEFDAMYQQKYKSLDFFVIIMAAGCGGRAFSGELYSKYYQHKRNFFILDYGSLLDCLWGYQSRAYMEIDPPKTKYILSSLSN